MNRVMLLIVLTFLILVWSITAISADISECENNDISTPNIASILKQHFELNRQAAIIKTEKDLISHLAAAEWTGSPLDALSDEVKNQFIDDLYFGNGGVASFNSAVLESELTPTESFAILALFGLQDAVIQMHHKRVETPLDSELNGRCDDGCGGF